MVASRLPSRLLGVAILALLGGALATPSATAGRSGDGCRDRGKTIVANERARVYELRDGEGSVFGCSYRSPRRRVDLDIRSATNGSSRFVLAGETVGLMATGEGCSRGACVGTYVESRSLRTGRRLQRIFGTVDRYVIKSNGSLAVAGRADARDPTLRLARADSTGPAVLAADIDPGSLALGASHLYWTEAGEPRTAPLR